MCKLHCRICKKEFEDRDLAIVGNKFECITCMGFQSQRTEQENG